MAFERFQRRIIDVGLS